MTAATAVPYFDFESNDIPTVPWQKISSFYDDLIKSDDDEWSFSTDLTCNMANLNEENKTKVCFCPVSVCPLWAWCTEKIELGMFQVCGKEREKLNCVPSVWKEREKKETALTLR
jgi:hypothetical protein